MESAELAREGLSHFTPLGHFYAENNPRAVRCKGPDCPRGGLVPAMDVSIVLTVPGGKYPRRTRYCVPCGFRKLVGDLVRTKKAILETAKALRVELTIPDPVPGRDGIETIGRIVAPEGTFFAVEHADPDRPRTDLGVPGPSVPAKCPKCHASLRADGAVLRRYVSKSEEHEDVVAPGRYTPRGHFEASGIVALPCHDLVDDSDTCAACGEIVG